ncbi:MAG: GGDEF domain-containing protein [Pseudomonadota bacterium]
MLDRSISGEEWPLSRDAVALAVPVEPCLDRYARLAAMAVRAPAAEIWLAKPEGGRRRGRFSTPGTDSTFFSCARLSTDLMGAHGRRVGRIEVCDSCERLDFDETAELLLQEIGAAALRERMLCTMATTDALTGAATRSVFLERVGQALGEIKEPLTLMMIDIDHFKRVNDSHGHPVGDTVLRALADRIRGALRKGDIFARVGGEEFAVALPWTPVDIAAAVAERLRMTVANSPVSIGGDALEVTVSIGVAPAQGPDVETAIADSDRALYRAKRGGRNQVVLLAD